MQIGGRTSKGECTVAVSCRMSLKYFIFLLGSGGLLN